ncbi:DOK7 protein, partial [Polyodon spathula]|nr:DOK7 protein [Polyodon spathula]
LSDCLLLLVYKDKSDKTKGHKERSNVTLEDICGLDPGLSYEGMSHTMAIICLTQAVMLGFENKEAMYAWDIRIRYSLGEVHRFHVAVLPGTKLESGPATLHLCNDLLVLVRDIPPTIIGQWKLSDLRRYGAVPNGFVFEGGTRCGYWAGVFFLACAEGEQISFLFDCIVRGISPTRGPFGLRPVLPDPNANPANMEDRVTHEALELEKRLSLLSHSSRQSSTASTSSYGVSVALGDDRSLSSSSSDTSHSDVSTGSRLTMWPEPSLGGASVENHGLSAVKSMHPGEEKMYAEVMRGSKPPSKPPRPRKLQEIGRQSSSDSGIATGSHSSYSGSFSSYAGSLDICQGDEFGSLFSLPLNFASDQNLCTCQPSEHPRAVGSDYQIPSSLRHLYDTPRSLLQTAAAREAQCKSWDSTLLKDQGTSTLLQSVADTYESTRDSDETYADYVPRWSVAKQQGQLLESKSSEVAPSAGVSTDPCEIHSPHLGVARALFTACPVCGGLKVQKGTNSRPRLGESSHPSDHFFRLPFLGLWTLSLFPLGLWTHWLLRLLGTAPLPLLPFFGTGSSISCHGRVDLPVPDRPRGDGVTYVNIPVSPTSKKQLHYMELERQEPGSGIGEGGSTKYAQIDITATETAHKVGTQHAQGREERLQELEQKRRGALQ